MQWLLSKGPAGEVWDIKPYNFSLSHHDDEYEVHFYSTFSEKLLILPQTSSNTVFLEKLIAVQPVKTFLAFYGP